MRIHDAGDGDYPAELSGDYTTDAPNNTITFDETGEGDTGFILPADAEWLLVEVYNIEGVEGTTGLTAYSSDISNIETDIEALRQEAIGYYTTFTIVTTHYKTGNLCDIYKGGSNAQQTKITTDYIYTPPVTTWKLTNALTAPWVLVEVVAGDLVYDNTNISTKFLTLTDMTTTSNILNSLSYEGEAISIVFEQPELYGPMTSIKDLHGSFEGGNISLSSPNHINYLPMIPDMTSNTSPSGTAYSNYEHGSSYAAWKAFDRVTDSFWLALDLAHYLQYEFDTQQTIDGYSLGSRSDSTASIGPAWEIHISDNGTDWTTADTQSGHTFYQGEVKTFIFNTPVTAYYVKYVIITLAFSDQSNVAEFSLLTGVLNDIDLLITKTPIEDGDNLIIVLEDDSTNSFDVEGLTTYDGVNIIPIMSSDTTPSGEFSASSVLTADYKAFTTADASGVTEGWYASSVPAWIAYELETPQPAVRYVAVFLDDVFVFSQSPKDWTFQGSLNGSDWVDLDIVTGYDFSAAGTYDSGIFTNTVDYVHYRLNITDCLSDNSRTALSTLAIYTIPIYEVDTTSITQGEIPVKVYTHPIVNITTDSTDNFLVEASASYTTASEEVLAVNQAPLMTSHTQPYGWTVSANNESYGHVYRLFADNTAAWATSDNGGVGWCAFEFPEVEIIDGYNFTGWIDAGVNHAPVDWTFEGWDGSDYVVLSTEVGITDWVESVPKSFTSGNTTPYIKYRMNITATMGGTYVQGSLWELLNPYSPELFFTSNISFLDITGISATELQTTIKLVKGDKMFELTGILYGEDLSHFEQFLLYDNTNMATEFLT